MNKFLALLCATAVFVGCASSHVTSSVSPVAAKVAAPSEAPVVKTITPVNANADVEVAALRAAIASPAPAVPVSPVATSAPVAPVSQPIVVGTVTPAPPSHVVEAAKQSITKTAVAAKSHKLLASLIGLVLSGVAAYFTRKYWLPLWAKLVAWLKKQRVVTHLEAFAEEAKTKIVVDFKDDAQKIDNAIQKIDAPVPPAPVAAPLAHPVTATPPVHESSAVAAFAKAEHTS